MLKFDGHTRARSRRTSVVSVHIGDTLQNWIAAAECLQRQAAVVESSSLQLTCRGSRSPVLTIQQHAHHLYHSS